MDTVEELRKCLVKDHGYSVEAAEAIKGKGVLKDLLNKLNTNLFGDLEKALETVLEEDDTKLVPTTNPPVYGDINWEKYVLEQFEFDELYDDKYPTLNGLRRVAINVLGTIVSSKMVQMSRNWEDSASAYCIYELVFNTPYGQQTFHGAADACPSNMSEEHGYSIYSVAIAENRAEARAYRKALLLKVVSSEEMKNTKQNDFQSVLSSNGEYNEDNSMSDQQRVIIVNKCKQLSLNADSFIAENASDKPTRKDAIELIKKLNDLQQ